MKTIGGDHHSNKEEKTRFPLALIALALIAFTTGTTEFVIMGLLPEIARDVQVSLADAGMLVSGYALGIVFGAPVLTVLTKGIPRKMLLLLLTGVFIFGNLFSALSYDYSLLMAARIIAGIAQGAITGVGAVVASQLVPPHKQGSAMAMIMAGSALANVVGVPIGTVLGQSMGWHFPFAIITVLSLISFIGIFLLVPNIQYEQSPRLLTEFAVLGRPRVILNLLMTIFSFGSVFMVFTYIVPLLQDVTGFSSSKVSLLLFLFGFGTILGGIIGGKLIDRSLLPSLISFQLVLIVILLLFNVTIQNKILVIITLFLFGVAAFGMAPGLQVLIIREAKGAPELASSFNISAFNLGAAGGSFLGGLVVESSLGLKSVFAVSVLTALIGLFLSLAYRAIERRSQKNVSSTSVGNS
ncbi:DHA1 family inner membrane transport protein [Bacillus fengqiuensis]|nr:DHA1 family inner membrane transport protein [Bacillus fengqiuensis]